MEKQFGIFVVNGDGDIYNTDTDIKGKLQWTCLYELYNTYLDEQKFTVNYPFISYSIQYSYISGASGRPYENSSEIGYYVSSFNCQFSDGKIYTPQIMLQPGLISQGAIGKFYLFATNTNFYRFYYSE